MGKRGELVKEKGKRDEREREAGRERESERERERAVLVCDRLCLKSVLTATQNASIDTPIV